MRLRYRLIALSLGAGLVANTGCGAEVAAAGSATAAEDDGSEDTPADNSDGDSGGTTPGAEGTTPPEVSLEEPTSACAARSIDIASTAPDMLIVLDRSLSMSLNRRWEPSKSAIKTITRDFDEQLHFGLSMFPGPAGDCSHGALDVPLSLASSETIAKAIDAAQPSGLTPTGPALQEALKFLTERKPALDGKPPPPAIVLLVTDGEPNCQALPLFEDTIQRDAAKSAVSALKAANIPTHVIGYQIDSASQGIMNELARLGGTAMYSPAQSAEQIVSVFRELAKDVISCRFELAEPPEPGFLRISVDARTIPADSFALLGKSVTLQGSACAVLKDGRGHSVKARLACSATSGD